MQREGDAGKRVPEHRGQCQTFDREHEDQVSPSCKQERKHRGKGERPVHAGIVRFAVRRKDHTTVLEASLARRTGFAAALPS